MSSVKLPLLIAITLFVTGCVTGTRNIDITTPEYSGKKKATGEIFIGDIKDARTFEAKPRDPSTPSVNGELNKTTGEQRSVLIGRQRNGYGKAMGDIALPVGGTVMQETRALLVKGLQDRGYTVTSNPNAATKMNVSIDKFWAWFTPGMWAISFEAEITTALDITTSRGNKKLVVHGEGKNTGQVASDANWVLAFDRALTDFLKNLETSLDSANL